MPRQGDEKPIQREVTPGVGRWTWADGTPLSQQEVDELGYTNAGNAGNFFDDVGSAIGFNPSEITAGAPGASLQADQANTQRDSSNGFIAALQQQAATGDGAWQQRFRDSVQQTMNASQAIGQSNANTDYGSSLDNIGNAQASARQRAVGEGEMLRTQSKLDARNQLGETLGDQARMDIGQGVEESRILRERRAANQALVDQSGKNRENTQKAITGAFSGGMGMSDGGKVPGRAQVFGDDERNDTVPAMLSPGEIVVPREMATQSPEAVARFVAAVKAQGGAEGRAGGGETGIKKGSANELANKGGYLGYLGGADVGRTVQYGVMRGMQDREGGTVDDSKYQETAAQQGALASMFGESASGAGPSIAPQLAQRALDQNIEAAQQAQQQRAPAGDVAKGMAKQGIEDAAGAARQAGKEQSQGGAAFSRALQRRRGQELQLASAKQQAGWQKTMADVGLTLEQQASVRNSLAAAGQGAAAFAAQGKGKDPGQSLSSGDVQATGYLPPEGAGPQQQPEAGDFNPGADDPQYAAFGGVIGMAEGGLVARDPATGKPLETNKAIADRQAVADARAKRKAAEYEEETGEGAYRARKAAEHAEEEGGARPTKKASPESAFAKAIRKLGEFSKHAGASVAHFAQGGEVMTWPDGTPLTPQEMAAASAGPAPERTPYEPPSLNTVVTPEGVAQMPVAPKLSLQGLQKGDAPKPVVNDDPLIDFGSHQSLNEGAALGIRPRSESAARMPTETPPIAPAVKPRSGGIAIPKVDAAEASAVASDEQAAAAAMTAADVAEAAAKVKGAELKANAMEQAELRRADVEQRTRAEVADAKQKYEQASQEMSRIDTSVDPGRFWASRTTGDKVVSILGLIFGALGAGSDGINRAAVMLNQAIDRDIDAQKAEHTFRMQKDKATADAAQNFYSMARAAAGDDLAAVDWAKAAALDSAAAQAERMVAATGDAQAKAKGMGIAAELRKGASIAKQNGEQRVFENRLKSAHLANETAAANAKAGPDKDSAKQVTEIAEREREIQQSGAKLLSLIDKYGTGEKFSEGIEEQMEQALNGMVIASAKMQDREGVVRKDDEDREKRSLGFTPGFFQRSGNAKAAIQSYIDNATRRRDNALAVRGLK